MERLRKTTKSLGQDSLSVCQELNPGPLRYEEVLTTALRPFGSTLQLVASVICPSNQVFIIIPASISGRLRDFSHPHHIQIKSAAPTASRPIGTEEGGCLTRSKAAYASLTSIYPLRSRTRRALPDYRTGLSHHGLVIGHRETFTLNCSTVQPNTKDRH
jgi:hypothetical protein